jgi:acylphosphatase
MNRRLHVWVSGRVQGVFFRGSCVQAARQAQVVGWVRNLPDGRVEAVFEGAGPRVEEMVQWCRQGPPGARVLDVQVSEEPAAGNLIGFEIE